MTTHRTAALIGTALLIGACTVGGGAVASSLINGAKIKKHTIPLSALSPSARRALQGVDGEDGSPGIPGSQGPTGPAGPPGTVGIVTAVDGPDVTLATSGQAAVQTSDARCPTGQNAIAGGHSFLTGSNTAPVDVTYAVEARDPDGAGWHIIAGNNASVEANVYAIAYCAPVAVAGAQSRATVRQARAAR